MNDAKEKVKSIELTNYAISNLANKSYVMQTWSPSELVIPNDKEGFSYIQPKQLSVEITITRMAVSLLQRYQGKLRIRE